MAGDRAEDGLSASRAQDLRLAQAAAEGDAAAQRGLVRRLMNRVRNTTRYILHHDSDADDAAQIAMLEILRCIGDYRGDGSLASWATRIATRAALAHGRATRREAGRPGPPAAAPADLSGAESEIDGVRLRRALVRCLDRINAERRTVVVLRLLWGMTLEEIAHETEAPVNTVKDRLRVGRRELRQAALEDPVLRGAVKERLP
jgi:RNA polymerase sigma-70 factor (ECF subfamily)